MKKKIIPTVRDEKNYKFTRINIFQSKSLLKKVMWNRNERLVQKVSRQRRRGKAETGKKDSKIPLLK